MTPFDSAIVIIWLIIIFVVGVASGSSVKKARSYWVNPGGASTSLLVLTIVATQVGAGTIVGIASSTFKSGTGFGIVALVSTALGFAAIGYFAPRLRFFGEKFKAVTLSEVLGRRYGPRTQRIAGIVIIFAYLSFLAGQLIASWRLLAVWTGWDSTLSLILAVGGLIFYTAFTGLKGDIETDRLHFWMMTIGLLVVLSSFIVTKVPIINALKNVPTTIWSPITFNGYTYVIIGIALGALIPLAQVELWMRVYASTDKAQAQRSYYWSAVVVLPYYLFALALGLVAFAIYPHNMDPDVVVYNLMRDYLPIGFLGVGVAAVLAVILSTANTMTLVIGASLYRDILYRGIGEDSKELLFSRFCTAGAGIIGAFLAFAFPSIVQQILNAFFLIAILIPPIIAAVYWRRATESAASLSIFLGFTTTVIFLFIDSLNAYIPGIGIALISFMVLSVLTKHSSSEIQNPKELFGE